jgi:FkbM family methyltransferase
MFTLVASYLVGETGKIIAAEPNPNCVALIRRELVLNAINNVEVHNVGLGVREEYLTLKVPLINSGEATFGRSQYTDSYNVEAKIVRGDDILENENVSLIKIDVEGFECEVIDGLRKTIDRDNPIIITEISSHHLEACGRSTRELLDMLGSAGYTPSRLALRRESGAYDLALVSLDVADDCDAVWIKQPGLHPVRLTPA